MKQSQSGFTLIEVMVVVVILAILATLIVPKIINRPEQARVVKAQQDVLAIQNALELYKLDNGFYPSTDQGLQALSTKPNSNPKPENYAQGGYLKRLPVDPWGHPYQYLNPGEHAEIDVYANDNKGKLIGNWNVDDAKHS